MNQTDNLSGYDYRDSESNHSHEYIMPTVITLLESIGLPRQHRRLFDLGCGNGSVAATLTKRGWDVTGVDPSEAGIEQARKSYPDLNLFQASAYDDLPARFGQFPVVISLEVVEHLYFPRQFTATIHGLLAGGGGTAIISTPYHGYLKNLALALTGKMDKHFAALWDYGHIKFWSMKTLLELLEETGFIDIKFERVGRLPPLAKSMIAVAHKGRL